MNRPLLFFLFLIIMKPTFAQKAKDTLIYNLPTINDRLIYQGTDKVSDRSKATLDSLAKDWSDNYFKLNSLNNDKAVLIPSNSDTAGITLNRAILEYKVRPGMVNIAFVAIIDIRVLVTDSSYSYKIDHIFFRPKNATLNSIGYQNDPEYLIKAYKRKHLGLAISWNVTRGQIREYLITMNAAVQNCIASLNNAMAGLRE